LKIEFPVIGLIVGVRGSSPPQDEIFPEYAGAAFFPLLALGLASEKSLGEFAATFYSIYL
jgi:hypothetical protein